MSEKYDRLSTTELREMLLSNTLETDAMTFDNYERLFRHEIKSESPNGTVIAFCSEALNQHNKYNRDVQAPSFNEITHRCKQQKSVRFAKSTRRFARMAAVIVACVVVASVLVQTVSLALGYNFFGFVRDWLFDNDTVGVLVSEPDEELGVDLREHRETATILADTDSHDDPPVDEFVFLDFDSVEDIPDEWLGRVSALLLGRFEFGGAVYTSFSGDITFNAFFVDDSGSDVTLTIQNAPMFYAEREQEVWVENIEVGTVTFEVFRNMDDYQVIWEHNGFLYTLNAFLGYDEVVGIIEGWYE
jgi:hypothetical protein